MLGTAVEVVGMSAVYGRAQSHISAMSPARLASAALAGADKADDLISEEMDRPKSGRMWPNLIERSSSPAETPAVQSGELLARMKTYKLPSYAGHGRAALDASSKQAAFMEFGFTTRDGGFHIRPFMRPGVDKYRRQILAAMKGAMRR